VLGLEIVAALAREVAIVETFVIEGTPEIPLMEFYETDELNGHQDNWVGPTVNCVLAMCRAAGFARVEVLAIDPTNVSVACWRKWLPEPEAPSMEPPELLSAVNPATFGINFTPIRDEYVACWFKSAAEKLSREDLCLEVGEFGAPAVFVRQVEAGWQANFRLPPGTPAGWIGVRLRLNNSRFGNTLRIAVSLSAVAAELRIEGVRDAVTFAENQTSGSLSCWIAGLPENADRGNVRLWLGAHRLQLTYVGEGQVNAAVPEDCGPGEYELRAECGGARAIAAQVVRVRKA
jgi:hypothetical protein